MRALAVPAPRFVARACAGSDSSDSDAPRGLEYVDAHGHDAPARNPKGALIPQTRLLLHSSSTAATMTRRRLYPAEDQRGGTQGALTAWLPTGLRPAEGQHGGPPLMGEGAAEARPSPVAADGPGCWCGRGPVGLPGPWAVCGMLPPRPPGDLRAVLPEALPAASPGGGGAAAPARGSPALAGGGGGGAAARRPPVGAAQWPTVLWCVASTQGWAAAARGAWCGGSLPRGPAAPKGGPHADFPTVGKLTRWLVNQKGRVPPPAVVLVGWREAKPCLHFLETIVAGRAGGGQCGAVQTPAAGVSAVVILAEGVQQTTRAANFVDSRERATDDQQASGPRVLFVSSDDELWDLLRAMVPAVLAQPYTSGGLGAPAGWTGPPQASRRAAGVADQAAELFAAGVPLGDGCMLSL